MAKRSRAEQDIEQRKERHADDPERVDVLDRAGRFKRSWVDLGEALADVRGRESFSRWGFDTFNEYCRLELHLRKATADKLTASFGYLSQHAPHVLARDGVTEQIPQPDTVAALARAREKKDLPDPMFEAIEADVLSGDISPASLARKFKEAVADTEGSDSGETKKAQRAVTMARRLADLLADLQHSLPDTLAADVEEQLGRLITYLNEEDQKKRR